jgi:hypothetical protein
VLLAGRGLGMDHPSAAANIATLVQVVAERPGQRILNAADPDAPNGLAISPAIAGLAGCCPTFVLHTKTPLLVNT